jgi:release factor glutamine methyltransferase
MSQHPSPHGETWTIQALLQWTTRFFESKGIEGARLDAELLLAHAMGWKRIDLYAHYDHVPQGEALDRFRERVKARGQRVPTRYLIGETEFFSLPLAVGPGVLIPRPETELLVERALAFLPADQERRVADLGTGSGAIAIALAMHRPQTRVVATDISPQAIAIARANVERHGLADRVQLRQGDWFAAFEADERFDAILSNPPYVALADLEQAMPEVRDHEPRVALDGGPDGLAAFRAIVGAAAAWLKPGGWLAVEVGAGEADAVKAMGVDTGFYEAIQVAPDFQGIPRIVSMRKKQ